MWKGSLVKYFWALAFLRWVGLRKPAGIFPFQSTKDISSVFSHVTLPLLLINKIWDHLANCNHKSEYCDWVMFYHLKNKSQHFSPRVLHKHRFLPIFVLLSKSIRPLSFHWNQKLSLNYTGMDYKSSYPSIYMFLFFHDYSCGPSFVHRRPKWILLGEN